MVEVWWLGRVLSPEAGVGGRAMETWPIGVPRRGIWLLTALKTFGIWGFVVDDILLIVFRRIPISLGPGKFTFRIFPHLFHPKTKNRLPQPTSKKPTSLSTLDHFCHRSRYLDDQPSLEPRISYLWDVYSYTCYFVPVSAISSLPSLWKRARQTSAV